MERGMADCRRFESDSNCQLTIIGPQDAVVVAAAQHAAASHGHEDTPELRDQIRSVLEPESAYVAGAGRLSRFPPEPLHRRGRAETYSCGGAPQRTASSCAGEPPTTSRSMRDPGIEMTCRGLAPCGSPR